MSLLGEGGGWTCYGMRKNNQLPQHILDQFDKLDTPNTKAAKKELIKFINQLFKKKGKSWTLNLTKPMFKEKTARFLC